ncbi:hypothetical protein CHU_3184 [Sporocytophaga myxococcoides]|uniref:Lipoprotein n=1 Tax=Sporocytophaga myxococcoides TaxID=153721 RepID=A0A098LC45_9BACT|nr:hypothetical protein [Sporocytophaga myxococcoides]GAL84012.1 hypothetical protein CHU_3184 [Sporocytophaga myxococcoides]
MVKKLHYFSLIVLFVGLILGTGCRKKDYPCPGLGKNNEADFSMFNESGEVKDPRLAKKKRGRIDKNTGLVNKKKHKRLNAPRKTHI